jgi:hypothetical protein
VRAAWLVLVLMVAAAVWLLVGAAFTLTSDTRVTPQTECCAVEYAP